MGFTRQFTSGFEDVADARRFVAATLLRDSELYEAARLLVDEAITNPLLHSEACEAVRTFQVTIAFRPELLHVEVHDSGSPQPSTGTAPGRPRWPAAPTSSTSRSTTAVPRCRSTATAPARPRWPAAASSCSTPWPSTGTPRQSRADPATWSGSSWKRDRFVVVSRLWGPVSSALDPGRVPERPKGAVCKIAGIAYTGSNPVPAT